MSGALFHQPTPPTASNNISAFYTGKSSSIASQCLQQPQPQQQVVPVPALAVTGDSFVPATYTSATPLSTSQQVPQPTLATWQHQQQQSAATSAADVSQVC